MKDPLQKNTSGGKEAGKYSKYIEELDVLPHDVVFTDDDKN
eukprot:CAMPEP_0116881746 /NCGR_PEP_ID=MMETSP0463-20121206/13806_1 /TAXON_ID=181622 /ORGANISM="Strombidinopsis sp, Strain SopsisLIS2011" /LENGTH=40 /DNA_ID= /DNA_START= /DNA_END= /DNA_ORIENTATION=